MASPGLILDRDGTITHERGYITDPADLELLPGVVGALTRARRAGWSLVVVTNQSAVGRGLVTVDDLDAMHGMLAAQLGGLDAVYLCPHLPDEGCDCRKPKAGLIEQAVRELDLDVSRTAMVGDNITDVGAAIEAGVKAVLVRTGHGRNHEVAASAAGATIVDDLSAAVDLIVGPDS